MSRHTQRKHQLHQLQDKLKIRMSLMDSEVEQLMTRLQQSRSQIKKDAGQLLSSTVCDEDFRHRHLSLIKAMDNLTQLVMSMNSSFFEFESDDSGEDEAGDGKTDKAEVADSTQAQVQVRSSGVQPESSASQPGGAVCSSSSSVTNAADKFLPAATSMPPNPLSPNVISPPHAVLSSTSVAMPPLSVEVQSSGGSGEGPYLTTLPSIFSSPSATPTVTTAAVQHRTTLMSLCNRVQLSPVSTATLASVSNQSQQESLHPPVAAANMALVSNQIQHPPVAAAIVASVSNQFQQNFRQPPVAISTVASVSNQIQQVFQQPPVAATNLAFVSNQIQRPPVAKATMAALSNQIEQEFQHLPVAAANMAFVTSQIQCSPAALATMAAIPNQMKQELQHPPVSAATIAAVSNQIQQELQRRPVSAATIATVSNQIKQELQHPPVSAASIAAVSNQIQPELQRSITGATMYAASNQIQPEFTIPQMKPLPQQQTVPLISPTVKAEGDAVRREALVETMKTKSEMRAEEKEAELDQEHLPADGMITVTMSHCNNPSSFYLIKDRVTLQMLTDQISLYASERRPFLQSVHVGSLCLAQFEDGVYYRARVIKCLAKERVCVYFVDFGNLYSTESGRLLALPPTLCKLPALAVHCCLSGVVSTCQSGVWSEDSITKFKQIVIDHDIMCKTKLMSPNSKSASVPTLVDLFRPTSVSSMRRKAGSSGSSISNVNVANILFSHKIARPIANEELLSRLRDGSSEILSQQIAASNIPPQDIVLSQQAASPDITPQEKVGSVPSVDPTSTSVPRQRDTDLASAKFETFSLNCQVQNIIRRIPEFPKKLVEEKNKADDKVSEPRHTVEQSEGKESKELQSGEYVNSADNQSRKKVHVREAGDQAKSSELEEQKEGLDLCEDSTHNALDIPGLVSFDVMPATLNNPNDFYVHKVSPETGHLLGNMMEGLNRMFERIPKGMLLSRSRMFEPRPGVLCCAKFSDGCYYRGLVMGASAGGEVRVEVFYLDFGETEWLPRHSVYPLPDDYRSVAPLAIWCSLDYVRPPQLRTSNGSKCGRVWSAEALAEFEKFVGKGQDKVLRVCTWRHLLHRLGTDRADAVQKEPLQVLLIDERNDDLCINHELILRKLAVHDESGTSDAALGNTGTGVGADRDDPEAWDDMERDARSLRNTYQVDIGDAGVALTGVKSRGGDQGACRFYGTPSGCWHGDRCSFLHVDPDRHTGMTGNLKQVPVYDEDQTALLPLEDSVVPVEVSCVRSPSLFYVVLPWGPLTVQEVASNTPEVMEFLEQESIETLNASMAEVYRNKRLDGDYAVYAQGEAVAAMSQKSNRWLRAKVIDSDPDQEMVLVMFVDYGDMEWISERQIRQLDQQFFHLLPQAVECCLSRVKPPPSHTSWPRDTSAEFFKMAEGKTLVAHVRQRLDRSRLSVELYSTGLETGDLNINTALVEMGLAQVVDNADGSDHPPSDPSNNNAGAEEVYYIPG